MTSNQQMWLIVFLAVTWVLGALPGIGPVVGRGGTVYGSDDVWQLADDCPCQAPPDGGCYHEGLRCQRDAWCCGANGQSPGQCMGGFCQ